MDKKYLFRYMTVLMVGIFFFGSQALGQPKQKMEISADIVFTNGKIYTVNKKSPFAEAVCEPPLTVNFQNISTGGAVSWAWDFGDGGSSTLQHPSYTYTTYGSFTVRLIATNSFGCSDTMVKPNFIVIRRATMSIPGLPARGCIPFTFNFNPVISSVVAITSYNWNFGDGGTSTLPNPTYTYNTQGTYDVTLTITTSTGCTDDTTFIAAIRVGSKPVADFSATPIPVCAHQPVQFTDLSVPADEWLWDFGDGGTSTLQNPTHSYNDTGFFYERHGLPAR